MISQEQIARFDATKICWQTDDSARLAAAFEQDGFLLIDNFATDAECASLRDRTDQLIDNFDAEANQVVFSASGQSHAASDYFMESAADIS